MVITDKFYYKLEVKLVSGISTGLVNMSNIESMEKIDGSVG